MPASLPPDLVTDLFRHRYAQLLASLCRTLGPGRLDLCEDVLQEAMLRALRVWPADGVPASPEAWLFQVARNAARDTLRRRCLGDRIEAERQRTRDSVDPAISDPESIADDTLRMLFLCSHPDVPPDARLPLLLKNVCGFSVPAIARALLQKEATIYQRLVRAKAKLQQQTEFAMPAEADLPPRLDLVLSAIYLLFNEGYRSHAGAELVRADFVDEAVRLCALLLQQPTLGHSKVHALLALLLLLGARSPARVDASGELVPLAQQDRSLWNRAWLQCGFHHFRAAIGGDQLTPFHVEAAIASLHAGAVSYAATDWQRILRQYDLLLTMQDTPVVRLNRAVATGKVHGPSAGLRQLETIAGEAALSDYGLWAAVKAQFHWELGDHAAAASALQQALEQPCSDPEQRLLRGRLAACERGEPPPPW